MTEYSQYKHLILFSKESAGEKDGIGDKSIGMVVFVPDSMNLSAAKDLVGTCLKSLESTVGQWSMVDLLEVLKPYGLQSLRDDGYEIVEV